MENAQKVPVLKPAISSLSSLPLVDAELAAVESVPSEVADAFVEAASVPVLVLAVLVAETDVETKVATSSGKSYSTQHASQVRSAQTGDVLFVV